VKPVVCSQAPAKIILFGEHFVVKGKPAIATAVNLYAKTLILEGEGHVIESRQLRATYDLEKQVPDQIKQFRTIYEVIREKTGIDKGFKAVIDSEIPVAAGMGSSAATAVSFTHALLTYYGVKPELELVNRIAYEAEKIVHGKPSGIDNTISTYGGIIYYRQGVFDKLDVDWPKNLYLVVIDTGVQRNTGIIVREVLELYDKYPEIMRIIYDAAEAVVDKARELLINKKFEELGSLININHGLLVALGLSIREIDEAVNMLKELGALGAKISGAGRGGIVYGLFIGEEAFSKVKALKNKGYRTFIVKPINEGVKYCF